MIYSFIDTERNKKMIFSYKADPTTKNKFYCVMVNPFVSDYNSKVVYGGSEEIIKRKIKRQYEKFKKESRRL